MSKFTESSYRKILKAAKNQYIFNGSQTIGKKNAIWRHDVDVSPIRALKMAQMEKEYDLKCVYHILLSSIHYNILEPETSKIFSQISSMGHEMGIHFDFDSNINKLDVLEKIKFEKKILQTMLNIKVESISFHNFTLNKKNIILSKRILGLRNLASNYIIKNFEYISDSNGFWNDNSLMDFLEINYKNIHVLTHPVWWSKENLLPIQKYEQVLKDKLSDNLISYLKIMQTDGRLTKIAKKIGISKNLLKKYKINIKNYD